MRHTPATRSIPGQGHRAGWSADPVEHERALTGQMAQFLVR